MQPVLMRPFLTLSALAHYQVFAQKSMPLPPPCLFLAALHAEVALKLHGAPPSRPHISANGIDQRAKSRPKEWYGIRLTLIKEVGLSEKARLSVGVMVPQLSLFRAGQHARNQTGILDRSADKPAGPQLTFALRRRAKNNAR